MCWAGDRGGPTACLSTHHLEVLLLLLLLHLVRPALLARVAPLLVFVVLLVATAAGVVQATEPSPAPGDLVLLFTFGVLLLVGAMLLPLALLLLRLPCLKFFGAVEGICKGAALPFLLCVLLRSLPLLRLECLELLVLLL